MKKLFFVLITFLVLFAVPNQIMAQTNDDIPSEEILEAEILNVTNENKIDPTGGSYLYQEIEVKFYKGSLHDQVKTIVNDTISIAGNQQFKRGDKVVVMYSKHAVDGGDLFYITDYVRRDGLLLLFVIFAVLAIAIGGVWGATSLIGMVFSFGVIFVFIIPQILSGKDPILIAIIGSALIIPITFSLSHGTGLKTRIAGLGTITSLIVTGVLAVFAVNITHLSGFGSEEAGFLQYQLGRSLDIRGLLLAGMIIASLGILDDITISQASIVAELKDANKKYGYRQLFLRAMRVGRDHIASLINTLMLVYAGASLPLLLLFVDNPSPFSDIVNMEMIAEEIVRTLVGSIGLILAVPITTLFAAYYYNKREK